MLNIAICDDDKIDLRQEKELIEEVLAEMEYEYTIDSYSKADELLNASQNYHSYISGCGNGWNQRN